MVESSMLFYLLINFEMQIYYQHQLKFIGFFSRDNLPAVAGTALLEKDGIYVISVDEYDGIRTHWVAIFSKNNKVLYFDKLNIFLKKLKYL